ncbi:probable WRKY transcription factor 26 isoform X2 [Phalaenopsis equestris]|uniref:probable WRKY transcription factor 26 isoform X2 n=1 Tax=Phalaenopsis equestris TaxID=78828 RepID=UPI0009E2696D|nr:probable WRKY transcription factor 26 isoform X2 [Phalaenopsis equestris]
MESMASSEATINVEEQVRRQRAALEWNNSPIAIPEDEYKWKKYGQKYIRRRQKNRSMNCQAKKKVEWAPNEPHNITILYEGEHNHRPSISSEHEEARISTNQYDLVTQMFGSRT